MTRRYKITAAPYGNPPKMFYCVKRLLIESWIWPVWDARSDFSSFDRAECERWIEQATALVEA